MYEYYLMVLALMPKRFGVAKWCVGLVRASGHILVFYVPGATCCCALIEGPWLDIVVLISILVLVLTGMFNRLLTNRYFEFAANKDAVLNLLLTIMRVRNLILLALGEVSLVSTGAIIFNLLGLLARLASVS
ncbi:hypothetical protein METBIDRAFT_188469 [Metschnikowia bicuspidata var. bicuspidata NRRL YB-4993]|uniref:Uncharacterized protein n=1 Tax=Metschnikowia bicuspidata var. bicuspidata NRRL YB-4993 TaxID=869754 RepID=A0A1A0HBT1_9ASCO|nr:hypothetical protein METBIDRAFT_188469 [Metschnikowia bicuspidata var. bicuspidata NRRL YB-4993]OBA21594.1 hypothetical protein METBIDRAFT_188469 [Metschnikowia bicuspidata var. bicuspidata NRRL YB-4993]